MPFPPALRPGRAGVCDCGAGAGAASRQSIGTTVFGGMLAATLLTLVFVPVFYVVIERLRERGEIKTETGHKAAAVEPAE